MAAYAHDCKRCRSSCCACCQLRNAERCCLSSFPAAAAEQFVAATQAKEIARLNGVYNKLLKDAGVEMIGGFPACCWHHTFM